LGSWVNVKDKATALTAQNGPSSASSLEAAIGRPLGITNDFIGWAAAVPVATLQEQAAGGTVPMVDWHCGAPDSAIAAGQDDATIMRVADALKSVGHPVFLRWYWEMNFTTDPQAADCEPGDPSAYIAAWRHIWTVFQQAGATNVAFVWCPGNNNVTTVAPQYYPGNAYVDWIAVDAYALSPATTFAGIIAPFYDQYSSTGKPLMVAETGALPQVQASYLQAAASALPAQFPDIKAFVYFDGSGLRQGAVNNWSLTTSGLAAFAAMSHSPYFATPQN
jgi:hypothetical protein